VVAGGVDGCIGRQNSVMRHAAILSLTLLL
jgi:hypothetical protein